MAFDAHANFATSLVETAPSPATSGTTLNVTTGQGARFPAVPFNAVVCPVGANATPTNAEIVRVTDRVSGNVCTIVRAQEGSTARSIIVGDRIYAGPTVKTLTDVEVVDAAVGTGSLRTLGTGALQAAAGSAIPRVLFDHYTQVGNVGTGDDDLYSDTIPANILTADGAKLHATYSGACIAHASNLRTLRVKFGPAGSETVVLTTSTFTTTSAATWKCNVFLIRSSSSVVQRHVELFVLVAASPVVNKYEAVASVTGLDFTAALVLKITGEISAGSNNDITIRNGVVRYEPPA